MKGLPTVQTCHALSFVIYRCGHNRKFIPRLLAILQLSWTLFSTVVIVNTKINRNHANGNSNSTNIWVVPTIEYGTLIKKGH